MPVDHRTHRRTEERRRTSMMKAKGGLLTIILGGAESDPTTRGSCYTGKRHFSLRRKKGEGTPFVAGPERGSPVKFHGKNEERAMVSISLGWLGNCGTGRAKWDEQSEVVPVREKNEESSSGKGP